MPEADAVRQGPPSETSNVPEAKDCRLTDSHLPLAHETTVGLTPPPGSSVQRFRKSTSPATRPGKRIRYLTSQQENNGEPTGEDSLIPYIIGMDQTEQERITL